MVTGSHNYTTNGIFTITLAIKHPSGGSGLSTPRTAAVRTEQLSQGSRSVKYLNLTILSKFPA
jgi:hypothetical protein